MSHRSKDQLQDLVAELLRKGVILIVCSSDYVNYTEHIDYYRDNYYVLLLHTMFEHDLKDCKSLFMCIPKTLMFKREELTYICTYYKNKL